LGADCENHTQCPFEMTISPENGYASVIFTLRKLEKNASVIFKLGAAENGS